MQETKTLRTTNSIKFAMAGPINDPFSCNQASSKWFVMCATAITQQFSLMDKRVPARPSPWKATSTNKTIKAIFSLRYRKLMWVTMLVWYKDALDNCSRIFPSLLEIVAFRLISPSCSFITRRFTTCSMLRCSSLKNRVNKTLNLCEVKKVSSSSGTSTMFTLWRTWWQSSARVSMKFFIYSTMVSKTRPLAVIRWIWHLQGRTQYSLSQLSKLWSAILITLSLASCRLWI